MRIKVTKVVAALFLLFACAAQAQQSVTLTAAATPKILTNIDGVNVQATGPGTISFTVTTAYNPSGSGSGTVTINPPTNFTAMDYGTYLTYNGLAPFSGQSTWTTSDPFLNVFFSVGGSLE